jgi:hypothetical protein
MIDLDAISAWGRKEADAMKNRAPEGAVYLLVCWPQNLGQVDEASAQLSSNINMIEGREHLKKVLTLIIEGLDKVV